MQQISILHLEDSPLDAELVCVLLEREGIDCEVCRVETRGEFNSSLRAQRFDLILADYSLPEFDGLSALQIAREFAPQVPFIFVSGTLGEEIAVEALRNGAVDYVLKRNLPRLVPSLRRALAEARARDERARAEAELRLSEQRFLVAVKSSPIMVYTTDRELRYTWIANSQPIPADQIIGHRDDEILPAESVAELMNFKREVLHSGVGARREIQISIFDRAAIYDITAEPLIGTDGEVAGLTVAAMDITDRRRREEELRLHRERMDLVVDASELGVWYCDLPFDKLHWNGKAKQHFFFPEDTSVTIESFYDRLHPDDRERTRVAIERSVATKEVFDVDYRTVSPTGQEKWLRATGKCYYSSDGTPQRFDGITIDVTERTIAAQEREQLLLAMAHARDEAEAANRMKDHFLATLSHELRTPLNAIAGWAQLIRMGKLDAEKLQHGLSVIERNAHIQTQLIDDLLDVSRIISGKLRLEVRRVDLKEIIQAALEAVVPAATSKGVTIERSLDCSASHVVGDAARLQQVVWNLLSNAVKFTPKNGAVSIALGCTDSNLKITVSDTGEGIQPEFLPYVFDRFRQAETATTTRTHGGLGLGLSIVRQLVEMHGGTVHVASAGIGRGATFTVTIPISSYYEPRVERSHNGKPSAPDAPLFDVPCPNLEGIRILVVDDEPDARDLLARVLDRCGASVTLAGSAREAIESIQRSKPNVLISDIGMPIHDGYSLIQQVRLDGCSANDMPAIALTAFAREEDRQRAFAAGFQAHLTKPIDAVGLMSAVAKLVERCTGSGTARRDDRTARDGLPLPAL